jgi:ATP/maltotriose-dependent transcriptional regulator MalT/DNA-binding SARP family transcriptional activator
MLVAGPGFGKTTVLSQAFRDSRPIWHTVTGADSSAAGFARVVVEKMRLMVPELSGDLLLAVEGGGGSDEAKMTSNRDEAVAAALAQGLATAADRDITLVIDDVHELTPGAAGFLGALCRHAPPSLHVVTASRDKMPFPTARLTLSGEAQEIGERELRFTVEEVGDLLATRLGHKHEELAAEIESRTSGWPVAVVYAAEAMARGGSVDIDHALGGDDLMAYLAEEVVGGEPSQLIEAISLVCELPWFTPELISHLAVEEERLAALEPDRRIGHLLNEVPDVPHAVTVSPVVRAFFASQPRPTGVEGVLARAAGWYEQEGSMSEAVSCHLLLDDPDLSAALLERRGDDLIARGLARHVAELIDRHGLTDRPDVALLDAEVRHLLGDWEGAMAAYHRLAQPNAGMPAHIAWRLGLLHHMRGDVRTALDTYRLGELDASDAADGAALRAWTASAHWLRGDLDEAEAMAEAALDLAQQSQASRPLATAHTVLAMVAALRGDRASNDAHYLRALDHAERGRDVVQTIRIRSNRGSHFLEEGDYPAALAEIEVALRLADMTGFELWRGMALANRGEVVARLGSLEEAIADLTQARMVFRRIGSRLEAYPLAHLGDVYAARGDRSLARSCYEQALGLLDEEDQQGLVPTLSGLARLLAGDDNDAARRLAKRATEIDSVIGRARALVALGWVEHAAGDPEAAMALAVEAAAVGRARRDSPGLAASLELAGLSEPDGTDLAALEEARSLWRDLGAVVDVARMDALIGETLGGPEGIALAAMAAETLGRLGAKGPALEASRIADKLARKENPDTGVVTLGRFAVMVDGATVPTSAWQSKVARDVLGMLVAARGRPIHREVLVERLWPDDDPAKAGNRLSVALSTIRGVLDPEKRHHQSHFVTTDRDSVALDLMHLHVDVETFLDTVARGRKLLRDGDQDRGLAVFRSAEAMYVGDFLEEHPYDEWAIPLREETRSVFVEIATVLASAHAASGDHDGAARRHLRILERDPYNEAAHISLVEAMLRAGRHGTARRLYGNYVSRMAELEVEPEPYPG